MHAKTCSTSKDYLESFRQALEQIDALALDAYAARIYQAWRDDRQVLVFGNGGSATTASHAVADLVKTASVPDRRRLRALCLSDNSAMLTAIGNDLRYEDIFVYPLQTYARRGDLAVAISASGNSPNVVRACEWARSNDLGVVALTGFDGGKIARLCDVHVHVPSANYGIVEDLHLVVGHAVTQSFFARVMGGYTE